MSTHHLSTRVLQHVERAFKQFAANAGFCIQTRSLYRGGDSSASTNENFYDTSVEMYATQPVTKISLHHMLRFGREVLSDSALMIKSANFVQEELPKRLARRLLDLQFLPHLMVMNPHIRRVYNSYHHAFHVLKDMPAVKNMQANAEFTAVLGRLIEEHGPMLDELALGLRECQQKRDMRAHVRLDAFLDAMLRSRISRRIIAEQHVALQQHRPYHVGIVNTRLSVREAAQATAARARQLCVSSYGAAPEVIVDGDSQLPFIAAHFDYMLYELLKNSMRATMDLVHGDRDSTSSEFLRSIPPIRIQICDGQGMVTLRVADQGGGLEKADAEQVWRYGFTTISAKQSEAEPSGLSGLLQQSSGAAGQFKMAGLGFGLPMTRLYARYFGGDCVLVNLPGYGVDVYLTVRHLYGWEWQEQVEDNHVNTALS